MCSGVERGEGVGGCSSVSLSLVVFVMWLVPSSCLTLLLSLSSSRFRGGLEL